MYTNKIPRQNDIVFVQLNSNSDNYVKLIDYNLSGLILCTEITKYKSNLKNIIRNNEIFPVVVLNSDGENIDLSYSKIKNDKRDLLKNCHVYQCKLYRLLNSIKDNINIDQVYLDNLIERYIGSDNYINSVINNKNIPKEKYEDLIINPSSTLDIASDSIIIEYIKSKIILKPYCCEQDFRLCVPDNDSLKKLKEILYKIREMKIEVSCKSSPMYQIKINNINLDIISQEFNMIREKIRDICSEYKCVLEFPSDYVITKKIEIVE